MVVVLRSRREVNEEKGRRRSKYLAGALDALEATEIVLDASEGAPRLGLLVRARVARIVASSGVVDDGGANGGLRLVEEALELVGDEVLGRSDGADVGLVEAIAVAGAGHVEVLALGEVDPVVGLGALTHLGGDCGSQREGRRNKRGAGRCLQGEGIEVGVASDHAERAGPLVVDLEVGHRHERGGSVEDRLGVREGLERWSEGGARVARTLWAMVEADGGWRE